MRRFAMSDDPVLSQYAARRPEYEALARTVEVRLEQLLGRHGTSIHSLSYRLKSPESLRRKIARPETIYRSLEDVTDVLGFRIVTYFEDATFEVAARIEEAFRVDLENSLDKRRALNPTQFGYRSLHYVCSLPVPEGGPRFEIQLRTILQHAWAEIEHDLGYKSAATIPTGTRRRFSRLASLLELADDEFLAIRRELRAYEQDVRAQAPEALRTLSIDQVSLQAFAAAEPVASLDREIASLLELPLEPTLFYPDYLIRMLSQVGLTQVDALERELGARRDALLAFVPYYFRFAQEAWEMSSRDLARVYRGYALVFLAHLVLLGSSDLQLDKVGRVKEFFSVLDYPGDPAGAHRVAIRLLDGYRAYLDALPAGSGLEPPATEASDSPRPRGSVD